MRLVAALIACTILPMIARSEDKLWGPVDMVHWRDTPAISGRIAVEKDVKEGRAAFYVTGDPNTHRAISIALPACAILHESGAKTVTPVIVIQAEETPRSKTVGYRPLGGGNGVCTLAELEILEGPDERFR